VLVLGCHLTGIPTRVLLVACRLANREIQRAGVVSDFGIGHDPSGRNPQLGGQNQDFFDY